MSSTDHDPTGDPARRKFDDIASLFGTIVPSAGTPIRPQTPLPQPSLPQVPDDELRAEAGPRLAPPPNLRTAPADPLQTRLPPQPFPPPPVKPAPPPAITPPAADNRLNPSDKVPAVEPPRVAKAPRIKPRIAPQARGEAAAEVPWPDAFAPRPNFQRTPMSRLWYWLFLIPFAVVVAVGITLVNPRSIRNFVDQTLPQYLPAEVTNFFHRKPSPTHPTRESAPANEVQTPPQAAPTPESPPPAQPAHSAAEAPATAPVVPAPASPAADAPARAVPAPSSAPAPDAPPPTQPTPAQPTQIQPSQTQPSQTQPTPAQPNPAQDVTRTPAPTPAAAQPEAAPPVSTPPSPAAAAASSSPAPKPVSDNPPTPPAPAESAPAIPLPPKPTSPALASTTRITVYYRRNQTASETEGRRVATKLGNAELRPSGRTARAPTILYFNPADREEAASLARTLADGETAWIVRASRRRSAAGKIDVLLP